MKSPRTWTGAALAASLTLLLAGCGASAKPSAVAALVEEPTAGVPVETGTVNDGEITARYAATATLEAEREASVVAEVSGSVMEILVEEGDRVVKGQVLARIDADRARLQVAQAASVVRRMQNDAERAEKLVAKQLIGRNAYEQSKFDFETQRAAVALAQLGVNKSEIRAPFDAVVTRRHVKHGQLLALNQVAFDLADFSQLRALLNVPERASVALKAGQLVDFSTDALPGEAFQAQVARVSPVVDRASGTVVVTVAVNNSAGLLRPGLFSRMSVVYDRVAAAALLPKSAVVSVQGRTSVFVVEDGKARRQNVQLGYEQGDHVQVLAGLASGATVITAGHSGLNEGAEVEVIDSGS